MQSQLASETNFFGKTIFSQMNTWVPESPYTNEYLEKLLLLCLWFRPQELRRTVSFC